ncbi:DUF6612 family protein [Actinomycetes bacterium NPDC127524]
MKLKWLAAPLCISILMLSACSEKAEPVSSEKGTDSTKESQKLLTLEQVYKKTTEAAGTIKSLSIDMNMGQVTDNGTGKSVSVKSKMKMDVIQEPISFYQKARITPQGEQPAETESYFTKDGFFTYDPTSKQWMKLPDSLTAVLKNLPKTQGNPADQLRKLQQFVNDFTFQTDNSQYILTLDASGDKFNDFIKEEAKKNFGPESQNLPIDDALDIKNVKYKYYIDKNTFYPKRLIIAMEMNVKTAGEEIHSKQTSDSTFSNFNKVKAITIPQKIIQSATDMPQ